jgi:hypothetical protein
MPFHTPGARRRFDRRFGDQQTREEPWEASVTMGPPPDSDPFSYAEFTKILLSWQEKFAATPKDRAMAGLYGLAGSHDCA